MKPSREPSFNFTNEFPVKELLDRHSLVVVECGNKKVSKTYAKRTKAKNMYLGRFFSMTKKICEKFRIDYVILSAKYGILSPNDIIYGYDKSIRTKNDIKRLQKFIESRFSSLIKQYDLIFVVAYGNYRKVLTPFLNQKFLFFGKKRFERLLHRLRTALEFSSPLSA